MNARHPFQVGDRVVCIDATPPRTCNFAPPLELGGVYTVTNVGFGVLGRSDGPIRPGVWLAEPPFREGGRINGWSAARFELLERPERP